jgi:hypothetical protein
MAMAKDGQDRGEGRLEAVPNPGMRADSPPKSRAVHYAGIILDSSDAHYTPVLGGVKRRKDKGLGSISGPWGPQAGLPGRLGFFDFFAAGEFQEVRIDFVGQPRIGIGRLVARL